MTALMQRCAVLFAALLCFSLAGVRMAQAGPVQATKTSDEATDVKAKADGVVGALFEKASSTVDVASPISAAEITEVQQFGQSLSFAEWLGPMAPVALSPFFGITCLSALTLFGGDWIAKGNPLLGDNSPLHPPTVFWTFLALTILTSLPRLTKVSKPFAQALDQLEAWSGIITMLVMKFLLTKTSSNSALAQAGLLEFSSETLLMLAAVVNIFVINTVRFFFEVLIWLTPIPLL
ncbi:MAG: hypothetical protein ACK58L_17215, partial [Planctomycetota bacterium]